jgi:hypothetical protein
MISLTAFACSLDVNRFNNSNATSIPINKDIFLMYYWQPTKHEEPCKEIFDFSDILWNDRNGNKQEWLFPSVLGIESPCAHRGIRQRPHR